MTVNIFNTNRRLKVYDPDVVAEQPGLLKTGAIKINYQNVYKV